MIHVVESIKADIKNLTNDQLDEVAYAIKMRRQMLTRENVRQLRAGAIVKFTSSRTGGNITGTVQKVNRKFVIVEQTIGGGRWKVPANMLKVMS
jgi:uncharacterized protein YkvS